MGTPTFLSSTFASFYICCRINLHKGAIQFVEIMNISARWKIGVIRYVLRVVIVDVHDHVRLENTLKISAILN